MTSAADGPRPIKSKKFLATIVTAALFLGAVVLWVAAGEALCYVFLLAEPMDPVCSSLIGRYSIASAFGGLILFVCGGLVVWAYGAFIKSRDGVLSYITEKW